MMKKAYRFFSILAALGHMGLIFYLSSLHSVDVPALFPQQDKVVHFICYGILGLLLANALQLRKRYWIALLLASMYGITDEFHQYFVPGRSTDMLDWLADTAGAAAGAYFFAFVVKKLSARSDEKI